MRKQLYIILCFLLLLMCLSACPVNTQGSLPYGKWESSDPHIVMDFNPFEEEVEGLYYGIYYEDDKEIAIYITFTGFSKHFAIYEVADRIYLSEPDYYKRALLDGSYTFTKNKLHYKVNTYWQEKSGVTHTIVFTKIEDYEMPDSKK